MLLWYLERFVCFWNFQPNSVHLCLSDKNLRTQNIDGLDYKVGTNSYIAIDDRLDKIAVLEKQDVSVAIENVPWDKVIQNCKDLQDKQFLKNTSLDVFKIS